MKVIIFVPGYLTSQTCSSVGDTYLDIYKYAIKNGYDFVYVPIPNNNYGDVGNTTLDDCLEWVLQKYNHICNEKKPSQITLVGHSMGGLIVSKLVTKEYFSKLQRIPDVVRIINPAIGPRTSPMITAVGTLLSFIPQSVLGLPVVPLSVAEPGDLYPGSMQSSPGVKLLLGSSLLRTTGKLFVNNTKWTLEPDSHIRKCMKIIQCKDDKLVSFDNTRDHANEYKLEMVIIPKGYHELFDEAVLTATFE
jgi:alpha-beta hydrolase superfamily lysophospholipase